MSVAEPNTTNLQRKAFINFILRSRAEKCLRWHENIGVAGQAILKSLGIVLALRRELHCQQIRHLPTVPVGPAFAGGTSGGHPGNSPALLVKILAAGLQGAGAGSDHPPQRNQILLPVVGQ